MAKCKEISDMYRNGRPQEEILRAFREVALDDRDPCGDDRTPLHVACCHADIEAVRILLERGAEINARDGKGATPLCALAMRSPHYPVDENAAGELTELMLSAGARIPRSGRDTTALIEAVRNRHYLMADAIIRSGCRLDAADYNGENALHVICGEAGRIAREIARAEETTESFAGARCPDEEKERIRNALANLREMEKRCESTARKLIGSGQIDAEEKNNCGQTAFDVAAEYGARRIGALLSGQDPGTDEPAARTGGLDIFQVLYYKDGKAIEALLRSGIGTETTCEHGDMYDFYGKSPLACAMICFHEYPEAAGLLLDAGADPNYRFGEEHTAFEAGAKLNLCSSKREPYVGLLKKMSRCGWNPELPADREGNTALGLACRHSASNFGGAAIPYLLETGADVNAANLAGQTPPMLLYGARHWDGRSPYRPYDHALPREEEADFLEMLLEAGADTGRKDIWGNTLLHYIAGGCYGTGAKRAVELLLDFGLPEVNAVNNEGLSALDVAASKDNGTLVKTLLKYS